MKLMVVTDEGVVLGDIEDLELYDLDKQIARSDLVDEIQAIMKRAES